MKQTSALLTDFYQLSMAYGYWQLDTHEQSSNTKKGVEHAITVGNILKKQGKQLHGVRLDFGDLFEFGIERLFN